jgi:hypothetical protein
VVNSTTREKVMLKARAKSNRAVGIGITRTAIMPITPSARIMSEREASFSNMVI